MPVVDPYPIAVGDEVVLSRVRGMGETSGTGTIVKIGRTLVHIDVGSTRPRAYRRDDQQANDQWSGSFWTKDQYQAEQRCEEAKTRLRGHAITVGLRCDLAPDQVVAIADFVDQLVSGGPDAMDR